MKHNINVHNNKLESFLSTRFSKILSEFYILKNYKKLS